MPGGDHEAPAKPADHPDQLAAASPRVEQAAGRSRLAKPWALEHGLLIVAVGGLIAVGILVVGFLAAPTWNAFVDGDLRGLEEATAEDNTRERALGLATATAAATAGVLAWGRLELSRREHELAVQTQITDRYARAVEQLGNADNSVRLGALYAMERLAKDSPEKDQKQTIVDVICAYVRQHSTRWDDRQRVQVQVDGLAVDYRAAIEIALRARSNGSSVGATSSTSY